MRDVYLCSKYMYAGSELVNVIEYVVENVNALFTVGDHFNSLNIHFTTSDFG